MESPQVLVLGCFDDRPNACVYLPPRHQQANGRRGLKTDQKYWLRFRSHAKSFPRAWILSVAMLRQNRRRPSPSFGLLSKTGTAMLSTLVRRLHLSPTRIKVKDANTNDTNVCQGAMPSIASVQAISDIWRQLPRMACVLDMEPFSKMGVSYSILCKASSNFWSRGFDINKLRPAAIAARLAKGQTGLDAVVAGFQFAQEILQKGSYFDWLTPA